MSVNHKDIGLMYFIVGFWGGFVGFSLRVLIRLELGCSGLWIGDEYLYNILVTIHGVIIVFFLVIPFMMGGFGN